MCTACASQFTIWYGYNHINREVFNDNVIELGNSIIYNVVLLARPSTLRKGLVKCYNYNYSKLFLFHLIYLKL